MSTTKLTDLKLKFEENVDESGCFGELKIRGIKFPDKSILPKFASSWRKRTFEKCNIRASATFQYNSDVTRCTFYLDYAGADTEADKRLLEERFTDLFPDLVSLFEEIIEIFLFDFEDGYVPYAKYVESNKADEEICDKMLDNFLRKFNFKTVTDDENKVKFQEGIQELLKMLSNGPSPEKEKKTK